MTDAIIETLTNFHGEDDKPRVLATYAVVLWTAVLHPFVVIDSGIKGRREATLKALEAARRQLKHQGGLNIVGIQLLPFVLGEGEGTYRGVGRTLGTVTTEGASPGKLVYWSQGKRSEFDL